MPARHARSTSTAGSNSPSEAVVCRWRSITLGVGAAARLDRLCGLAPPFAVDEALVFADEELEVLLLLVGKFHEDLLALGVLEPLAVFLEEAMRATLAFDADEQRLLIVHALAEPVCALGEQPVRRA